jgi:C4-dicarboxylate-specific signal transduction histidine kinase
MPTPSSDPGPDRLPDNWTHAGRVLRSVAHNVNNHFGAIMAYAELIAAAPDAGDEAHRMAAEISKAVRSSSQLFGTMTSLVSDDLSSVDTIHLNELVSCIAAMFRFELERSGSRLDLALPGDACVIHGVRTSIVRALTHVVRRAADSAAEEPPSRRISLRLARAGDIFRIEIDCRASSEGDMPPELAEAREHLRFHRGDLEVVPPGTIRVNLPRVTGLLNP